MNTKSTTSLLDTMMAWLHNSFNEGTSRFTKDVGIFGFFSPLKICIFGSWSFTAESSFLASRGIWFFWFPFGNMFCNFGFGNVSCVAACVIVQRTLLIYETCKPILSCPARFDNHVHLIIWERLRRKQLFTIWTESQDFLKNAFLWRFRYYITLFLLIYLNTNKVEPRLIITKATNTKHCNNHFNTHEQWSDTQLMLIFSKYDLRILSKLGKG